MVLVTAQFDEQGNPIDFGGVEAFTGTEEDGTWVVEQDCQGWTGSQSGYKFRGMRGKTVRDWASQGLSQCLGSFGRLLCFEEDSTADQLPDFEEPGALVFVTSVRRFGNLGAWPEAGDAQGVEAGDEICRNLARSAGLQAPDSFVAWLSDSSVDAKDRLAFPGPWKRLDGVPIAADLPDLTDGTIFTSISVTEKGDYVRGGTWTGTDNEGNAIGETCADWADGNAGGRYGQANMISWWSDWGGESCADFRSRLYCFSQVVHESGHFADGFESGDTSAWTSTVP